MTSGGRRVLVAEDHPALLGVIRFNLERAGFQVLAARNGREAQELLQAGPVDLVLTDQQMPEMTGSELCRWLRRESNLAHLPVIMLTAKGWESDLLEQQQDLQIDSILPKPFSPRELIRQIEDLLALHRSAC